MPHLAQRLMSRIGRVLADLVFPPLCLGCGEEVDTPGHLCPSCWTGLGFIDGSLCRQCGLPFEADMGPQLSCAGCVAAPPGFVRARSVLRYDDASRPLILAFKHGDRLDGVPAFARWMARVAGSEGLEGDIVVPVPLHRLRLFSRRYNQAALLAHGIGRALGREVVPDLLRRTRATPSQGGRTRVERRRNVAGAFAVRPRYRAMLAGRSVLLVDDVMTTGATLDACAGALHAAGAVSVNVITLARAV